VTTPDSSRAKGRQPSAIPGVVLLGAAAVLIVIVLINPHMAQWLKIIIAIVAVLLVVALLVFAFRLFRLAARGGRR
jgi:hypothetical protein